MQSHQSRQCLGSRMKANNTLNVNMCGPYLKVFTMNRALAQWENQAVIFMASNAILLPCEKQTQGRTAGTDLAFHNASFTSFSPYKSLSLCGCAYWTTPNIPMYWPQTTRINHENHLPWTMAHTCATKIRKCIMVTSWSVFSNPNTMKFFIIFLPINNFFFFNHSGSGIEAFSHSASQFKRT